MKLLIISNMAHYLKNGQIVGWGPTAQEIDALAQLFDNIRHIACLHPGPAPASCLPYQAENIQLVGLPPAGGDNLKAKLDILQLSPLYFKTMLQEIPKADAIHVRGPANIPLLALLLLAVQRYPPYRWVKYAGNWKPDLPEPLPSTFQRFWLQQGFHRGVVTVNGSWPHQPKHVYSFLNPCLSDDEIEIGQQAAAQKQMQAPYQLLFAGHLASAKGAGRALQIAHGLQQHEAFRDSQHAFDLHMIGDGVERSSFEVQARDLHLLDNGAVRVHFHGWLPRPALQDFYQRAHFFLLPSVSEGWPKVLSEAMAYGVIPLASAVSSIPQILDESGVGAAIELEDINGYVRAIQNYLNHPEKWRRECLAGPKAARRFTYTSYLKAVQQLFLDAWEVKLEKRSTGN